MPLAHTPPPPARRGPMLPLPPPPRSPVSTKYFRSHGEREERACASRRPGPHTHTDTRVLARSSSRQTVGRFGFCNHIHKIRLRARACIYTFRRKIIIQRDRLHIYTLYIFRIYHIYGVPVCGTPFVYPRLPTTTPTNPKPPPTALATSPLRPSVFFKLIVYAVRCRFIPI